MEAERDGCCPPLPPPRCPRARPHAKGCPSRRHGHFTHPGAPDEPPPWLHGSSPPLPPPQQGQGHQAGWIPQPGSLPAPGRPKLTDRGLPQPGRAFSQGVTRQQEGLSPGDTTQGASLMSPPQADLAPSLCPSIHPCWQGQSSEHSSRRQRVAQLAPCSTAGREDQGVPYSPSGRQMLLNLLP